MSNLGLYFAECEKWFAKKEHNPINRNDRSVKEERGSIDRKGQLNEKEYSPINRKGWSNKKASPIDCYI